MFDEIFSKENCNGLFTSYYRNPKLSSTLGYSMPFSEHGIVIDGIPARVHEIANFLVLLKDGSIYYSLNGRVKEYAL